MEELGDWQGTDDKTGFQLINSRKSGRTLRVADGEREEKVITAPQDPIQKNNSDHVGVIAALGMAKEGFDWTI